jgi:purine-binding chemotaxis protein CheW
MPRPRKIKTEEAPRPRATAKPARRRSTIAKPGPAAVEPPPTLLEEGGNLLLLSDVPASADKNEPTLESVLDALFAELAMELNNAASAPEEDVRFPAPDLFACEPETAASAETFDPTKLEAEMKASFEATMTQASHPNPVFQGLAALLAPNSEKPDEPVNNSLQLLLFELDETLYGLPLENLVEINRPLPVTTLPNLPSFLLGIANVRGDIVSVLDMRAFFGQQPMEVAPHQRMLYIRAKNSDLETLVVIDQVREFHTLQAADITCPSIFPAQGLHAFLKGYASHQEQTIHLLDVEKLLHESCAWRQEVKRAA